MSVRDASEDFLHHRVGRTIFSLFYVMHNERESHPRIRVLFFVISAFLFFFAVAPIPSFVYLTSWFNTPLYVLFFSFSTLSVTALIVTTVLVAAFSIAVFANSILVIVVYRKDDVALQWPLPLLRGTALFLITCGFMPMLGALVALSSATTAHRCTMSYRTSTAGVHW